MLFMYVIRLYAFIFLNFSFIVNLIIQNTIHSKSCVFASHAYIIQADMSGLSAYVFHDSRMYELNY